MRMNHSWTRKAALCIGAWICAIGHAMAADRTYETTVGTLIIDIDSQWREVEAESEGITGIAFETGGGGQAMNFIVGTMDDLEGHVFRLDDLREVAARWRNSEATEGKTATDVKDFAGTRSNGVYFHATGAPAAASKPGEFRWMTVGFVVTRSSPLVFVIAWNEDGKAAADRAFAAVKGLRFVDR